MKRIYKTLLLALGLNYAVAQPFWTPTAFKGAFDCNAAMWTDSWTEWDPQNKSYPVPTQTVSSNITSNMTWATGQTILLEGQIYVKNNAVLTIQPGVVVLGSKAVAGSGLFITKGAQLVANGTAASPIVFTSDQAPGSRSVGDWGGISLMGKASLNYTLGLNNIEGIAASADTEYGGGSSPNDNDNSGSMKYVRLEFTGYVYQPNKEINGLTFGAVGRGTTVDFVQVSYSNDDAFEWFGGTVNCKHLVSFRNLDDDFDCDNGFSGNVQYGLIVRDPSLADNPTVSTSEGFECDNDASGTAATPFTTALFSNITAIGPYRGNSGASVASGYRRALRLRRNMRLKVFNSLFMDFKTGLFVDGTAADANAGAGDLLFKHNIIAFPSGYTPKTIETTTANVNVNPNWFSSQPNDSLTSTSGILVTPYSYTSPDYRPVCTNTTVNSGASFTHSVFLSAGIEGVNDLKATLKNVSLYPNPTANYSSLVINTMSAFDVNVMVSNVTGQIISRPYTAYHVSEGENQLSLNMDLPPGIYFINAESQGHRQVLKLVINK